MSSEKWFCIHMKNENLKQTKSGFSQLPLHVKMMGAGLLLMALCLCIVLCPIWMTRQDYSFGFLTPLFVLYVLFDRKEEICAFFSKENKISYGAGVWALIADFFFGAVFFCGIAAFAMFSFMFYLTQNHGVPGFSMTFAFSFTFIAATYIASIRDNLGNRTLLRERLKFVSLFVFPAFVWLISAPLFRVIESRISLFLLSIVSDVVYHIMDFLGYIVKLRGNTIEFPNGSVGVADACSGIRSLTACIFAGSFLAAVMFRKTWKKFALVICSMVLAFFFNLCRALFLAFWAYENGADSISGTVHDAAGYIILGCTVVGLLAISSILNLNPVPKEFRGDANPK